VSETAARKLGPNQLESLHSLEGKIGVGGHDRAMRMPGPDVQDAVVEVFRCDPDTGARLGEALHRRTTGADGRWGPAAVEPGWSLELVVAAPGHPITHVYRSGIPRSSAPSGAWAR
jgi:hypothetical protein